MKPVQNLSWLFSYRAKLVFFILTGAALVLLSACAPAATALPVATQKPPTQVPSAPQPTQAQTVLPQPTQAPTVLPLPTQAMVNTLVPAPSSTNPPLPTQPGPTSTQAVEARVVELEWPSSLRLGDSDVLRLALAPSKDGYTITAEFPKHNLTSQNLPVKRPGGYELQAVARLDGVGFDLSPGGDQVQYLPVNESTEWRWSIRRCFF